MPSHTLIRHRVPLLIAVGILTVGLAVAGAGIGFDFSPQALYAGSGDLIERTEAVKGVFGHSDAVLLVVLESVAGEDVLAPEALTWAADLARAAEQVSDVVEAEALPTLELPSADGGLPGPRGAHPLLERLPAGTQDSQKVRAALRRFPLLEGVFVSRDRRAAAVMIFLDPDARQVSRMREVLAAIETRLARQPPPAGYRARLSGLPAIRTDVVASLEREQVERLPLACIVVFVVLVLVFRRVSGTLLPLAAVVAGMAWAAGAFALTDQSLNLVSNILPVFLFTIGMANAVHVVNRYAEECQRTPGERDGAATRTVAHMSLACLLTYLTTAIGFLSLAAARSEVLQDVGVQTALGLVTLYVSTMLVLGSLLSRFEPPRRPAAQGDATPSAARLVVATGRAVARHPRFVLVVSLALVAAALAAATRLRVDCRATETYDADHPMSRSLRLVEAKLGGVLAVDVSLAGSEPGALLDPRTQGRVAAFARFAAGQPDVLRVRSHVDYHAQVLQRLPEDLRSRPESIAAAHAACSLLGRSLHYERFLTKDAQRARVLLRVADVGSRRLLALFAALEGKLAELFPDGAVPRAELTGDAVVFARAMDGFIRDILASLLGAAVVIFGVIALLFRSLRYGLISILPNLTPLLVTAGYMRVRGYALDASNVIVFAISLGVAVDNTIHFLARFREELRPGADVLLAIERSLRGAGRAMVLTSLLLVLGLATLHVSEFVPTRRFAELTSITMVAALVGDLCLLPACLVLLGRRWPPRAVEPGRDRIREG